MADRGWNKNFRPWRGGRGGHGRDGGSGPWRGGGRGNFRDHPYVNQGGYRGSGGNFQKSSFGGRFSNQNRYQRPPTKETPGKRLAESEIGVTEYISDHTGFNGIIKSRYSDFQVSEINLAGQVAKLTDLTAPDPPTDDAIDEDEDLLLTKYNVEILPMDTWDKINKLAVNKDASVERVEVDVTGMSKEERTKIHDAVKKAFGSAVIGSTVTNEDKKFVCFDKYRKGVRIDKRVKWVWPGDYVHFIVHKENCDTMDAANKIAERIKLHCMKPSTLSYAGTKDRRGKTSQWFSIRRVEPSRIVNGCKDLREIQVGNFAFSKTHLQLGMLRGNRFRIALRNVTAAEDVVRKACSDLEDNGFINYYGLQRFGTRVDIPTYNIGLKLLQSNFKEAIDYILEEREGPLQAALHAYKQSGDAALACRYVARHARHGTVEARLLAQLGKDSRDLMQALDKVPRNTRLLYIHSYQSLIWNRCVSERLRRFGLRPAVGDLVLVDNTRLDIDNEESLTDEESDSEEHQAVEEKVEPQPAPVEETPPAKKTKKKNEPLPVIPVKILTQQDIDNGRYKIEDVILPLPGYNIEYPPNMIEFYTELLTKDGVTLKMKSKYKAYSMSGAYRHMIVRPTNVTWSLVKYQDPYADLILSDLDELNDKKLTGVVDDGKYTALLLTMDLPASCYATMALRELLKVDTSGDTQAAQNNYHKTEAKGDSNSVPEKNEMEDGKRKLETEESEAKKVKVDETCE